MKLSVEIQNKLKFLCITVLISLITIFIGINKESVEARPVTKSTQQIASAWKNARFPVDNFSGYTSLYGNRISAYTGQVEFHNGLDIGAPMGSYIYSWWSGQVVKVSDSGNCGTSITIKSGEWTHIYCHMSGHVENTATGKYLIDRPGGIQILEGTQVNAGTRIGRVGMTGLTTGPHLHWGLKYGEKYIDPAIVLTQMYRN